MDKKTVTTISYLSRLKIDEEKEEKITKDLRKYN
jgi:Asp-tRNA(Asn)/Glu-tRNA(Gln) amidotransferase C subunit